MHFQLLTFEHITLVKTREQASGFRRHGFKVSEILNYLCILSVMFCFYYARIYFMAKRSDFLSFIFICQVLIGLSCEAFNI